MLDMPNLFGSALVTDDGSTAVLRKDLSTSDFTVSALNIVTIKFPISGVIAWFKSLTGTPTLPSSWVECNGQVLSDADSPLNGVTIPNLNASGGGSQRFLRGSTTSGTTGGADTHYHTINIGKNSNFNIAPAIDGTDGTFTGAGTWVDQGGGEASTARMKTSAPTSPLPSYTECVWIMKVK